MPLFNDAAHHSMKAEVAIDHFGISQILFNFLFRDFAERVGCLKLQAFFISVQPCIDHFPRRHQHPPHKTLCLCIRPLPLPLRIGDVVVIAHPA
jgi:hypothetical protein